MIKNYNESVINIGDTVYVYYEPLNRIIKTKVIDVWGVLSCTCEDQYIGDTERAKVFHTELEALEYAKDVLLENEMYLSDEIDRNAQKLHTIFDTINRIKKKEQK